MSIRKFLLSLWRREHPLLIGAFGCLTTAELKIATEPRLPWGTLASSERLFTDCEPLCTVEHGSDPPFHVHVEALVCPTRAGHCEELRILAKAVFLDMLRCPHVFEGDYFKANSEPREVNCPL